ncbi:MauE/DoxX family redox-associated membrane protein [Paenibacillus sp. Dod16]|uniref:MauE/DoxX family redox-associated membrane protein n=1 Tax=Paenibacillus sp. Dod16 TaxID=3416392 RepID=UPI003CED3C8E
MYDLLAISVTLPMLLSVVSFGWSRAFGDPDRFPGSARLHALLILLQVLSVTMVYGFPSRYSFLGISLLYFVQGVGVAYFIRKKGRVDCGCLGPQISSKLGFPLIGFNLAMGLMGLAYSHPVWFAHRHSFDVTGLLMEGMMLLLSLFIIIGVPDALHAIRIYREIAGTHISKIKRL